MGPSEPFHKSIPCVLGEFMCNPFPREGEGISCRGQFSLSPNHRLPMGLPLQRDLIHLS